MDDLNLLTVNTSDMDSLLKRASTAVTWARMGFRAKKSRSLVIVKGKVSSSVSLEVESCSGSIEKIPSILEREVRFLGKMIDAS